MRLPGVAACQTCFKCWVRHQRLCHLQSYFADFVFVSQDLITSSILFTSSFQSLQWYGLCSSLPSALQHLRFLLSSSSCDWAKTLIGSNHTPSYSSPVSCVFAHLRPETPSACLISVLLMSSGLLSFILIILPSPTLRTCQLGTVTPRPFVSQDCSCSSSHFCPRCSFPHLSIP